MIGPFWSARSPNWLATLYALTLPPSSVLIFWRLKKSAKNRLISTIVGSAKWSRRAMDWIGNIGTAWLGSLERLAWLAAVFAVLSRLMPCNPEMHWWSDRRAFATDLVYWFCMPFVYHAGRYIRISPIPNGSHLRDCGPPGNVRAQFSIY